MKENDKNTCKIDISLDEFKDIIFREQKKDIEGFSPFDYLVTDSYYELSIENDRMLINFKLKLTSFKNEEIKIKLLDRKTIVVSTEVNKGELGFDGEYYSFFAKSIGDYEINIKYLLDIEEKSNLKTIEFKPLINSKIKLYLPENDNYNISNYVSLSQKIKNKQKIVNFYNKEANIKIIWGDIQKKEENKAQKQVNPIIHTNSQTVIDISDNSISYNSKVLCNIYQTPINKLEFSIKNAQIITITGNNIKNYDIKENNNESNAIIYFEHEIEGEYNFNIYYEKELNPNEELINIGSLTIKNTERDEGYLAIYSKTVNELEFIGLNNIRIIDINELPSSLKQSEKIKEALKYLITPYEFDLKLVKHKNIAMPESNIKNAIFNTVILKKGIILHSIHLEVKNNSKPFIQMQLDKNTIPLSSFVKGKPVKAIKSEDGNMMLSLPKFNLSNDSFWIEIVLISYMDKMKKRGNININLPKFDITISHLYWKLYLPDKFKYKKFKGNIEKLDYFNTEPPIYPYNYQEVYNNNEIIDDYNELDNLISPYAPMEDDYEQLCDTPMPKMETAPMPIMAASAVGAMPSAKRSFAKKLKAKSKTPIATLMPKPTPQRPSKTSFTQKQVGKIPIKINLPLVGEISYYEKLFIENETIKLNFNYKRIKKETVKAL